MIKKLIILSLLGSLAEGAQAPQSLGQAPVRPSLCSRITNTGIQYLSAIKNKAGALKNKAGGLLSAVAQKSQVGMQEATRVFRDYIAPTVRFNKEELLACTALSAAATTGIYLLTGDADAFYSLLPLFNLAVTFCEQGLDLSDLGGLFFQPLLLNAYKEKAYIMWAFLGGFRARKVSDRSMKIGAFLSLPIAPALYYYLGTRFLLTSQIISTASFYIPLQSRTVNQVSLLINSLVPCVEPNDNPAQCVIDRRLTAGRTAFASLLIKLGADVNYSLAHGTPLQIEICNNQLNLVQKMLKHGAHVDAATEQIPLSPLMIAVGLNRLAIVKELLKYDADIKREIPDQEIDCMGLAREKRFSEVLSLLRNKRCADLAPYLTDHLKLRDLIMLVVDYE